MIRYRQDRGCVLSRHRAGGASPDLVVQQLYFNFDTTTNHINGKRKEQPTTHEISTCPPSADPIITILFSSDSPPVSENPCPRNSSPSPSR